MVAQRCNTLARLAAALLFAVVAYPAVSHQPNPTPASITSTPVTVTGTVAEITVDNELTGASLRYFGLKLDQGSSYALNGAGVGGLVDGARINATGTINGNVFNVYLFGFAAPSAGVAPLTPKAVVRKQITGTLAVYHKDFFEQGHGEYGLAVRDSLGNMTLLNVPTIPDSLEIGMLITVAGSIAADGTSLDANNITILGMPAAEGNDVAGAPITNTVLVIPIRFSDTPAGDPFTGSAINTEFQTHVAPYYQEVSYGQQLLNITVACSTAPVNAGCTGKTDGNGWLQSSSATPASCDFTTIGTLADAAATAAGYDTSVTARKFVYYVLPSIASCGWAGLAYVGWGHAWSNGYNALWVYGHELGHNFGLWHSGSLSCGAQVIGGSCGVSEYGDPFDVMGNIRQMHFNSMQKAKLNWIPSTSVKHHTTGTQTYQLSPIESAGQTTYAVTVPVAADTNRTYWIEYRQPIGLDSPLSSLPNLGAQVRVGGPAFDFPCGGGCGGDDTELLDMTPGSSSGNSGFDDAALLAGHSYTDSYGITINVISATTSLLTLSVTAPGALGPAMVGAVSRKTHGAAGVFDLSLSMVATNPTTEPRQGPAHSIVFDFGKPITSATATVTEGIATAAAPTFSGNTVVVNLSGVANHQYVTVSLSNVTAADGASGGAGSVRIGFLAGDVNQNRVVSVADVAWINSVLARAVTAANYLQDVNASGTLTVADKAIANADLAIGLPAP